MKVMKTTCLINNYNYSQYIIEAVESALGQTVSFDEIIVVDDGSTDDSVALLRQVCHNYSTVRLIEKANGGQLSCFEAGFAEATGDIIFFLDADDVYRPEYLATALAYYRNNQCDFLMAGMEKFGNDTGKVIFRYSNNYYGYSVLRTWLLREWIGMPTSALSMRRWVLAKIFPYPDFADWRVRADDVLVYGASLVRAKKGYCADPLVNYRIHGANNYTGRKLDKELDYKYNHSFLVDKLIAYYVKQQGYTNRTQRLLYQEFLTHKQPNVSLFRRYLKVVRKSDLPWAEKVSQTMRIIAHFLFNK